MTPTPFHSARALTAVASLLLAAHAAQAQVGERSARVVRAIVPFSTGGTNDITARLIAPYLAKALGQQVVIENRPGAAGNIGIEAVAKSAPDGHTILFSATASTQNPALFRNLRFDPLNDIQPVAAIAQYPYAIMVNAHLPVKNVRDLISLAQKNAATLNAAAGGIGTRLSVELAGKTPAAIVQTLHTAVSNVVALPEVTAQLRKLGGNVDRISVNELTQWYRREIQTWKDIVARAKIPPVD